MTKKKEKTLKTDVTEIEQFILDSGSDDISTFGGTHIGGVHCQQVPDELAACLVTLLESDYPIKSYLEIGVASGGTTYIINHFLKPEKIVIVDDNKHPKASLRDKILKGIERQEAIGNSGTREVLEVVDGKYDLIIIDAEHTYEGVKSNVINYLPMLNINGFLIIHDSAIPNLGEIHVVKELKKDKNMKFIKEYISTKYNKCGIALFRRVSE